MTNCHTRLANHIGGYHTRHLSLGQNAHKYVYIIFVESFNLQVKHDGREKQFREVAGL